MFIIVGNNINYKRVLIYDTTDCSRESVSYECLKQALDRGIEIKGLDENNNILCQTLDAVYELLPQIQQIYAKALLLKVTDEMLSTMLLHLFKPYGFANTPQDIDCGVLKRSITLKPIGADIYLDQRWTVRYRSIKLVDEFKKLDNRTRCMLSELAKIPCLMKGTGTIDYITGTRSGLYCIKTGKTLLRLSVSKYNKAEDIDIEKSLFASSPHLYKYYLECIQREKPKLQYYIDALCRVRLLAEANQAMLNPPDILLYKRKGYHLKKELRQCLL